MTKLKTVRLYGKLGNQFGRVHQLAVANVREAVKALSVLLPGFERELITSKARGIVYAVFIGKKNINEDDLHHPAGREEIRIAPILQGAKQQGIFQTMVGAALIAVGAVAGKVQINRRHTLAFLSSFLFLLRPPFSFKVGRRHIINF